MNSKHFTQYWLNIILSKTKFGNYGHLIGPFVIDNMWLQCKRSNKIHVLLFVTNFHVPIIVSFNHWATHQPHQPNQCQHGSTWGLRSRLCTSLHFRTHFVLVAAFVALKQNVVSYPEVWSLFVCLFLFFCLFFVLFCFGFIFTCQFCKLPLFPGSPKEFSPPLPDPFLKLDPRLCNILLRHCICIMYRKHRIRRKAVGLLEI